MKCAAGNWIHIRIQVPNSVSDWKYFYFVMYLCLNRSKTKVIKFNLIIVYQDATVFSLLYFCRQLYMFRLLTPSSGARTAVIAASGID
jgi:hypothetical protein